MSDNESPWLAVIGRSLALLVLRENLDENAGVAEKAEFLESLGITRAEVAEMLGTTANSIQTMAGRKKRKRPSVKRAPSGKK